MRVLATGDAGSIGTGVTVGEPGGRDLTAAASLDHFVRHPTAEGQYP